ncbi:MAG: Eco57I restriction-modification methylase domain-containing protein, partial [Bacteroidetes bacterium]|nr:Eco57I restriction-modification methylase domain-containing protein [Bacteroidota bacterium]
MESKNQIKSAIQTFFSGNFTSNALSLFQALGYVTERQAPLHKKTKEEFRDTFVSTDKRFDETKAKFTEWKYVDLLFQLSKEEVLKHTSLFDTKKVDSTIIETYLFFAIELSKDSYSRTELSLITREVNRLFPMPAMILFKHGDTLTLSVINRRLHKRDESKDVLEKVTQIKDINIANPHRAHIEILFDLSFDELKEKFQFTNFVELHNAWQKTLDIKELNKRFFNELANWYFWATTKVVFPDDEMEDKEIRNATGVIRLITRLMFAWFLKEKNLVPEDLFDEKKLKALLKYTDKNKSTYYKAILQNLFFATLNTEMGKRKFRSAADKTQSNHYFIHNLFRYEKEFVKPKETLEKYFDPIPFLNGGLFECLDKQIEISGKLKPVRIDGFSDRDDNVLKVPDELFFSEKEKTVDLSKVYGTPKKSKEKVRGLIDLLSSYEFTIAENTPIEEEVALDPELLGKVFENLLANYNPETQTTARKQTGSFYTPREIVNYMVDESLLAYLQSTLRIPAQGLEKSVQTITQGLDPKQDALETFFNPNNEIQIHQGNLPHWQQENVWYFITFRLADSIPADVAEQIKSERELWLKKHKSKVPGNITDTTKNRSRDASETYTKEELKEYYRLFSERVETLLNAGKGSCVLKDKANAEIVANAMLHFNHQRYELDDWIIMPNHVHVLVKPIGENKLPDILHSWKSFTANKINEKIGKKGQLWMHESYDHIVRNEKALQAIRNYIRQNPVKAGLSAGSFLASGESESTGSFSASGENRSRDASDTMRLRTLLSYSDNDLKFSNAEKEKLIHAIDNIKIIDPACGSGAFPMGILHKLVHILHKLDPKNELWEQRQIEKASAIDDLPSREAAIDAIKEAFENNELDYGRKLYLIENCIYGVDIQPIAVQISKLRFFISLIVDQKNKYNYQQLQQSVKSDNLWQSAIQTNMGVRPLPNLETKFVAANTLIALEKEHANLFTNPEIEKKKEQLKKIRHDYFEARTPKRKANCREKDKQLRDELAQLLVTNHDLQPATAKKVAEWNPYDQNASASFFDMEWMFGLKEGFDVVIGNPPYVSALELKKLISKSEYDYLKSHYLTAKGTVDFYIYFFEKGVKLCKEHGILSYISPNRYLSASYGEALRKFIFENAVLHLLVDYSDVRVFESASTYPVLSFIKKKKLKSYRICVGKFDNEIHDLVFKYVTSEKLDFTEGYIWGFLLNNKIGITEKVFNQSVSITKACLINATSTASEADLYHDLINEKSGYKLINTGTIDRYANLWGKE